MKKIINKRTFEKKYSRLIEHPQDKKFFISCYEEKDGYYYIKDNLSKEQIKKLKKGFKVIKANRKGPVRFLPLIITSSIIAGLVFFFTVIVNPLLGHALEKGLEAIFEAKSDVKGFRLSLIRFEISMKGVTVANADAPMTNLFQMSRTIIKLKPEAVLRGKIYIEEIRADSIRFGTPRTVSGAIPGLVRREKKVKERIESPPLIDLANFDAMALLNQEFDKLNTPKIYDEAINAYNETFAKWEAQYDSSIARVEELRAAAVPIMNINTNNLRDIQAITSTVQDITTMINSTQNAINEVTNIVNGLEADINMARQLEQNARNALNDDINHLKSYLDLGSGAAFAALEPFIRDVLSDTVEQYIDYGLIALDALDKIQAMSNSIPKSDKPKKEQRVVFKGRDIIFPTVQYPQFYLGIFASDFTLDTWNWSFDLRSVSSNPDLSGRPTTLNLGMKEDGGSLNREVLFAGSADLRTNASERFSAQVDANRFPVSLTDQMSDIGINGFTGESNFNVSLAGHTGGRFNAGASVIINNARLLDPVGTIAEAAAYAVSEADNINLGISFSNDSFSITSNLADLLAQAIRRIAEVYARQAIEEIERLLRLRINEYIDGRFGSRDNLDQMIRDTRQNLANINQIQATLNSKREELEQRIRSQANQQAEQAIQNILPGGLPSTPSIPGLPRR